MPNFPKNTGFKLPGMGSKEIDTPGNFRKDQKVEDVGYCSNTESHMLPPGSSPLLKRASMIDQVVPEYYKTSYTGSNWPMGKGKPAPKKDDSSETKTAKAQIEYKGKEYNVPDKDVEVPNLTGEGGNSEMPNLVKLGREGKNQQGQILTDTKTRNKGWSDLEKEFISQGITGDALTKKMNEAKAWRKANPNVKNVGITETNQTFIGPDGKEISEEEYRKIFGN
tara:strand:+ start:193 stop:861 length:669 start_codon:yes stop_codon:yes gene_type:complete